MRNNFVKLFESRQGGNEVRPFKDISYLELWQSFCSAERNHLCNSEIICAIFLTGVMRNNSVKLF